jgi:hypothetical protein
MTHEGKHTPGPWSFETGTGRGAWIGRDGSWSALACGDDDETAVANAHLIAAAPDLLNACEEFVRKVEAGEARSTHSYTQMKAAIAKATGQ